MKIVGMTIGCGPVFHEMASHAAYSFIRHFGCECIVLDERTPGAERPHRLKFDLFKFAPYADAIVFFDADLVWLEMIEAEELVPQERGIAAVRDITSAEWILADAARAGVAPEAYFNSGLMIIRRDCRELLDCARDLSRYLDTPFQDQTAFNAAARLLRMPIAYLPGTYNFHVDREFTDTLEGVKGAHLHWIKDEPPARLAPYYHETRSLFWKIPAK